MAQRTYPSEPAHAGVQLFREWFGRHFARSVSVDEAAPVEGVLRTGATVGRRWRLGLSVVDTLTATTNLEFEAGRAALEQRLDDADLEVALWIPRGAAIPTQEPATSDLVAAIESAPPLEDGRLEVRRPVDVYLRRTSTQGSVVTVLGGLSGQWAQFTNKVPGSFQLSSSEIHRLPWDPGDRDMLLQRIVSAAAQPEVDEGIKINAEDAWTANRLDAGRSFVLGVPGEESDESSAELRRTMRRLLKAAVAQGLPSGAAAQALVVMGAATYAEDEKLSWSIRGMDPRLYAPFDIITVLADGVVKPMLLPGSGALPWDAPLRT